MLKKNKILIILILFIVLFLLLMTDSKATYYPYTIQYSDDVGFAFSEDIFNSLDYTSFCITYGRVRNSSSDSTSSFRICLYFINDSDYPYIGFNGNGSFLEVVGYNKDYTSYKYVDFTTFSCNPVSVFSTVSNNVTIYLITLDDFSSHTYTSGTMLYTVSDTSGMYINSLFNKYLIYSSNTVKCVSDSSLVFQVANRSFGIYVSDDGVIEGYTTGNSGGDDDSSSGWLSSIINWFSNIFDAICNLASNIASAVFDIFSSILNGIWSALTDLSDFLSEVLYNILYAIGYVATSIWDLFSTVLQDIFYYLGDLVDYLLPGGDSWFVTDLLSLLCDLLKSLFVPDDDYFEIKINGLKEELDAKIPYSSWVSVLEDTEDYESTSLDITVDLNNYKLTSTDTVSVSKFVNFNYFAKYRDTWYSWVRVFVYIFLVIYNMNEAIKFMRGFNLTNGSGKSPDEEGKGD